MNENHFADGTTQQDGAVLNITHYIFGEENNGGEGESLLISFCRNLIYFILGFIFFIALGALIQNVFPKLSESCHCAISDHFPEEESLSTWIFDTYIKTKCNAPGHKDCQAICTSLALMHLKPYQKGICSALEDAYKYKGTLYYRPCTRGIWQPMHLKMSVCCKRGHAYDCKKHTDISN